MKYFANIHNAEELRKAYRQHVINMHPDRGGNEEEFKAMQAEFESLKKQYQSGTRFEQYSHTETAEERARRQAEEQREREEWARWEAEEKARREQEEREKAERIRKAQEVSRAAVRAWAGILEQVAADATGKKARYYRFADKKEAAAFVAATKRNITKVINHYFPGLKVRVTISGEIWKEKFVIKWEDGPSEKQLRDTCKELAFFIPAGYCCAGPYEDYGHYEENDSTAPWREAYGQALGDIDDYSTERTLSDEGKQQAEELAARYFANFDPKSEADKFTANLQELSDLLKAAGIAEGVDATKIFREITGNYYGDMYGYFKDITGEVSRRQLRKMFAEHISVTVTPKAKAPEFVPTYGPAYKAIKKALGANVFYVETKDSRKNSEQEQSIFEAAERLARGEAVQIGHKSNWDGDTVIYGTDRGGYKTQQKRAAKFEAVGIILEGTCYNTYGHINAQGIKAETLEALRREAQDIVRQRKEWERKQQAGTTDTTASEGTQQTTEGTTANEPTDTPQADTMSDTANETAPAEGLELVELGDGLAVIGNSHTTYKHRRDIKAHGCTWNKQAARWEAHNAEDCETLRRWFALRDTQDTDTTTDESKQADTQSDTAAHVTEAEEITDTTTTTDTEQPATVSPLLEAVADVLRIFADIMEQAKEWEGVTVPAATLARWKQEATESTKTTAARLCEVCACLASLTPESRRDFDALGGIFWTLSEQIRNGYDPATLQGATDYARAQLFDLIERTQNRNQARAIREANEPDSEHRAAA